MLIIVCGLPGSGKTTLAERLAKKIGAVHLSSDIIRKQMHPKPAYTEEEKREVYVAMARKAQELVRGGGGVVLDATFYRREYRAMMEAVAQRNDERLYLILCTISDEEARRRIGGRKGGPSDADFEVYLRLKEGFEPIDGDHLEIDFSLPEKEKMKRAFDYVGVTDG